MLENNLYFIAFIIGGAVLNFVPLIHKPFKWMETFFHEFSHGLAALLTFGKIHRIVLRFDGSGYCTTSGGFSIPILLAGYAGATMWGCLIYLAGWFVTKDAFAHNVLHFLAGLILISVVFWVRDLITIFIATIMIAVFLTPIYYQLPALSYILQFIGLYVVISSLRSPLYLIDGQSIGDGADLARKTLIPEGVWIILWFVFALLAIYWLWQITQIGYIFSPLLIVE